MDLPETRNIAKQRSRLEILLTCLGTAAAAAGYFLPWLANGTRPITGFQITLLGYPYLALLPVLAAGAAYLVLSRPNRRPLPAISSAGAGLLLMVVFFSAIVNYDTAPLALRHDDAAGFQILYTTQQGVDILFGALTGWSWGIYLCLIGFTAIYLAAWARPGTTPSKTASAGNEPIHTLDDIRPRWERNKDYKASLLWIGCCAVLVFTYMWCGISVAKLWENRGNAKEYLLGRELSKDDLAYIADQTRRAPEIEAQGRARGFLDNKYRGIPMAEQPTLQQKMAEHDRKATEYLSAMTEVDKERLRRAARISALEEKKGGYFPPETAWLKIKGYLIALLETMAIAVWGTLLAIVFAVPASLFAARNTLGLIISGESKTARTARYFCIFGVRRFLDACRGFNEFVMALIFVAVIGLGPFAGILALWIHTFGILAKVFSEQIEAIDNGQIEALASTGASVSQIIAFSVLPQVMPGFVSYALLRFESNVRSAAILGFVGAGGIGFLIFDKLNGYLFREVATMMIIIIVAVGIIDQVCGMLRNRFI